MTYSRAEKVKAILDEAAEQIARLYDETFGDDKKCKCGHDYYRHFDTYEDMFPIGCKYCGCGRWEKPDVHVHDFVYVEDEYGSLADGGSYEVYKCKVCGHINYSPLPD